MHTNSIVCFIVRSAFIAGHDHLPIGWSYEVFAAEHVEGKITSSGVMVPGIPQHRLIYDGFGFATRIAAECEGWKTVATIYENANRLMMERDVPADRAWVPLNESASTLRRLIDGKA